MWEIERRLAEDGARPIVFYDRRATCWQPHVKGLTIMVNSISNGARMEDVWLDKQSGPPHHVDTNVPTNLALQPCSAAGTSVSVSTQGRADRRQICRRGENSARCLIVPARKP